MNIDSIVKLTINFNYPDLSLEESEAEAQHLLKELKQIPEIETVNRVIDPNPPEDNMSLGGFLVGLLMAEVNVANAKKLMEYLGDRLGSKPIELSLDVNGKKLTVKAHSREELDAAIKAALDFIAAL